MNMTCVRLKAVPIAVAALLGGLWSTVHAIPVSYGDIVLDASYALGGTYTHNGVPPAGVLDGMTGPDTTIYQTSSGADMYMYTASGNNNAFFHTYGFTGANTYFGARASGAGDFFASTRATFSRQFTNTQSTAQMFNFSFTVANGELGILGQGAGFAELMLNVKKDGTSVSRSRTTITQTTGVGDVSCDSSSGLGTLAGYMNCASPTSSSAFDNGGPYGVSMGLIGAGESFVLDYDIIATVSGNLTQGTRTETQCYGGEGDGGGDNGGYGEFAATFLIDNNNGYGGNGQTCVEVEVPVFGEAIARSGDPFGLPIFNLQGDVIYDPGQAGLSGNFSAVPEPGSIALVGLGLAGLLAMRRKRKDADPA